jgi:hypothetical protein
MLTDKLKSQYKIRQDLIKVELNNNIKSNSAFSLTLNAWTAINQDSYLGIII